MIKLDKENSVRKDDWTGGVMLIHDLCYDRSIKDDTAQDSFTIDFSFPKENPIYFC